MANRWNESWQTFSSYFVMHNTFFPVSTSKWVEKLFFFVKLFAQELIDRGMDFYTLRWDWRRWNEGWGAMLINYIKKFKYRTDKIKTRYKTLNERISRQWFCWTRQKPLFNLRHWLIFYHWHRQMIIWRSHSLCLFCSCYLMFANIVELRFFSVPIHVYVICTSVSAHIHRLYITHNIKCLYMLKSKNTPTSQMNHKQYTANAGIYIKESWREKKNGIICGV